MLYSLAYWRCNQTTKKQIQIRHKNKISAWELWEDIIWKPNDIYYPVNTEKNSVSSSRTLLSTKVLHHEVRYIYVDP
jgi:hypothetical protein